MIAIRHIDHVVLRVKDIERMRRFYCEVLGMEHVAYRPRLKMSHLRGGSSLVDLVEGPPSEGEGRNMDHLCFRVDSVADVEKAAAALRAAGIATSDVARYPQYSEDYWATFLTDPDGVRLEITNYRQQRRDRHDRWEELAPSK